MVGSRTRHTDYLESVGGFSVFDTNVPGWLHRHVPRTVNRRSHHAHLYESDKARQRR